MKMYAYGQNAYQGRLTEKSNLLGVLIHIDSNLIFPLVKFHHKPLKLHLFLLFISFI